MIHCTNDQFCVASVFSHCDEKCGRQIHLPPGIPIYDGHIHLKQNSFKIQADCISFEKSPPIREFYLINNNHKPNEWLSPTVASFAPHVHVFSTLGIHPKYFIPRASYEILHDMKCLLALSQNSSHQQEKKIVAVGECGLDETSNATIEQQIFIFEKQINLAVEFHLPLVLHCRGTHLYKHLFDCLKKNIPQKNINLHWHCVNENSNFHIIDLFLNEFPNSFIGLNGFITYETSSYNSMIFKNWLLERSSFLSKRLMFETDYPYLCPRNLHSPYDPPCAILSTSIHLSNMIKDNDTNFLSYLYSSNLNIKKMYEL